MGQIWINLSNLKAAIFLLSQSLSSQFSAVPNAKWGNTHNSDPVEDSLQESGKLEK